MTLRLARSMILEMMRHAIEDLPNECCGVILGEDGGARELRRGRNAEASPFRYDIHSDDLLQFHRACWDNGWDFLVIYHSHVGSRAYPSPTDVRLSQWPTEPPTERYPGTYYVIVSLERATEPVVRAFTISAAGKIRRVRIEETY